MPRLTKILMLAGLMVLSNAILGCASQTSSLQPAYGVKINYAQGQPLRFPDFTLTYSGQRRVTSSNFPRGFLFYDFELSRDGQSQTISWSSGTGDIGPTLFEVGGRRYMLELAYSDKLGRLAETELVVSPLNE